MSDDGDRRGAGEVDLRASLAAPAGDAGANDSANTATPIGRLTRKTQCQLSVSVRTPPSSTPMLPPPAITKPKTPIAFVRSTGR